MVEVGGKVLLVLGPSKMERELVAEKLVEEYEEFVKVAQLTTREVKSEDSLKFIQKTEEEMEQEIKDGSLLICTKQDGFYDAVTKSFVDRQADDNKTVVMAVDNVGARIIQKRSRVEVVTVFLMPVSNDILYEKLKKEASETGQDLEKLVEIAKKEISFFKEWDREVRNVDMDSMLSEIYYTCR